MDLRVNITRIVDRLNAIGEIGYLKGKGINRLAFTEYDKQARDLIIKWMKELNLQVKIDQIGNIFGIREGVSKCKPVMTGSHIDTVLNAGKYDGVYGVVAGLELINVLNENNINTKRPIIIAVFSNEEGVRFSPDMLGSSVFIGRIPINDALKITNSEGEIIEQELTKIEHKAITNSVDLNPISFVELHVEQGPVLEIEDIQIGIVERVVGINWFEIEINGNSNHAGTTPIENRIDPAITASEIILFVRELALDKNNKLLATCGNVRFEPNMINVIAEKVTLVIDLRSANQNSLEKAKDRLFEYLKCLMKKESVRISFKQIVDVPVTSFDQDLLCHIENITKMLDYRYRRITSGAGHDAQLISNLCSSAMIFVPSKDGISHTPKEFTFKNDLEAGANVLLYSLLEQANS